MENVATDENWKTCFSQLAPGLLLFARQWTRSSADAEDIVQEAFIRFWRKQHDIANRGLLTRLFAPLLLIFSGATAGALAENPRPFLKLIRWSNQCSKSKTNLNAPWLPRSIACLTNSGRCW